MQDETLHLQKVCLIQSAEISSLLLAIQQLGHHVRKSHPEFPDLTQQFLHNRKVLVQKQLEQMETTNPARAAQLQKLIDDTCTNYPFGYE